MLARKIFYFFALNEFLAEFFCRPFVLNYQIYLKISPCGADRRRRREKLKILAKKSGFRSKKRHFFQNFGGGPGPLGPLLATPLVCRYVCNFPVRVLAYKFAEFRSSKSRTRMWMLMLSIWHISSFTARTRNLL